MPPTPRIFELRTYIATPGRLDALQDRFRDHTLGLFKKHGLEVAGFWVALDADNQPTETLVYLLSFESREAAKAAWATFYVDPDWVAAKAASEVNGPLTTSVQSVFLAPTDYSAVS
jgi:hypothetical protein